MGPWLGDSPLGPPGAKLIGLASGGETQPVIQDRLPESEQAYENDQYGESNTGYTG
jgi:hypothetical protein